MFVERMLSGKGSINVLHGLVLLYLEVVTYTKVNNYFEKH